jgi:hypothetical protein
VLWPVLFDYELLFLNIPEKINMKLIGVLLTASVLLPWERRPRCRRHQSSHLIHNNNNPISPSIPLPVGGCLFYHIRVAEGASGLPDVGGHY